MLVQVDTRVWVDMVERRELHYADGKFSVDHIEVAPSGWLNPGESIRVCGPERA